MKNPISPLARLAIRQRWHRLLGRDKFDTGYHDYSLLPVWRCTKCGCHFVGESCPAWKHK